MILGRTPEGLIKTKSDGGLRAVNCACCGGCPFPKTDITFTYYGPPILSEGCFNSDVCEYDQNGGSVKIENLVLPPTTFVVPYYEEGEIMGYCKDIESDTVLPFLSDGCSVFKQLSGSNKLTIYDQCNCVSDVFTSERLFFFSMTSFFDGFFIKYVSYFSYGGYLSCDLSGEITFTGQGKLQKNTPYYNYNQTSYCIFTW